MLNANAADVGACVTYYTAIVDIYIKHILGWDVKAHKSVPGGGVFGETSGKNMLPLSPTHTIHHCYNSLDVTTTRMRYIICYILCRLGRTAPLIRSINLVIWDNPRCKDKNGTLKQ